MGSVYRTVPTAVVPRATGVLYILNQLGGALGIAVVALVLQRYTARGGLADAFADTFWWLFGAAILVTVAARILPGRGSVSNSSSTASEDPARAEVS